MNPSLLAKPAILFEDESLVAVLKPAGLKVHGADGMDKSETPNESTLEDWVAEALGRRAILLHRLDRDTTGVVLFAKRKDVAGELSRAFEEKRIRKSYWAVVEGSWPKRVNKIETWIGRDPVDVRRQKVFDARTAGARSAVSTFRLLGEAPEKSWLEVIPKTGRTHQIRVQCSSQGHVILGDRLYGSTCDEKGLALHARRLVFRHPATGKEIDLVAPPPEIWASVWLRGFKSDEGRT